ncbi:MAG: hypothetical protein ACAF41_18230 [Leptolyngbya sp. BL-A-14]
MEQDLVGTESNLISGADIGADTGIESRLLAEQGVRVLAIELNAKRLRFNH